MTRQLLVTGIFFLMLPLARAADVERAEAKLQSSASHHVGGKVSFTRRTEGILVKIEASGVEPGLHGFHIHEKGDCSAPDFSSAGPHYNPGGESHGGPASLHHHAGDLGNVNANEEGLVNAQFLLTGVSLGGDRDLLGRSVVLHEAADDLKSDPAGNSGARIACGLIQAAR